MKVCFIGKRLTSLSRCAWNTGSRPARPMSDARHSPYGDRLKVSRPVAVMNAMSKVLAEWHPVHWSEVRNCSGPFGPDTTWSYVSTGKAVFEVGAANCGVRWYVARNAGSGAASG